MCGIAGFSGGSHTVDELYRMGARLTHRGPDETGAYYADGVGLISKRLSIVDPRDGKQPAYSEDGRIVVVLNGEIFNFTSLRNELFARGHRIANASDTAVLPHMYEEYGASMFSMLSGQFAIAIWDKNRGRLLLARDRMGIIPLFFRFDGKELLFGSEIKALLACKTVKREFNFEALRDVFMFWSPQYDRTVFSGIFSLLPGEYLEYENNAVSRNRYYSFRFKPEQKCTDLDGAKEKVEALLCDAVQKRLMGDVKICTYLSGGLDSSLITAIMAERFDRSVEAFSIGFEEERLDESGYQTLLCDRLGIKRNKIIFKKGDMPGLIREMVFFAETPLLRAGPIPLFKLSELVNQNNVKVVLSGEGADEFFGGYDIFREVKLRNYLKKHPDSEMRRQLLRTINQFSDRRLVSATTGALSYFYSDGGEDEFLGPHLARWRQFGFFERFFSVDTRAALQSIKTSDYREALSINPNGDMKNWSDMQKSQYLEIITFLSQYLLSSQGDRISMSNSVEVRFPFLDDELIDYCASLNDSLKIKGLNEKYILKKVAAKYLPKELIIRKKFPYRYLPDARSILSDSYNSYMLSEENIRRLGIFDPAKINGFTGAVSAKDELSERECMLLMGVLTTQILCDIFDIRPA